MGAVGDSITRIVESSGARKADSKATKRSVDFEDFGAVDDWRVLSRSSRALRDISGGEVGRDFARVKFVLQRDLDCVPCKGDRSERGYFGIDTSNACNQEIGLLEVEYGRSDQGRDGTGSVDFYGFCVRIVTCRIFPMS